MRRSLLAVGLMLGPLGFGPSADETAGLEYSKQLYAEGEAAMAAEDFATALAKYKEGYRYAPTLHIFTLNIATAAEAAGDCATAKKYYQHFVDLVPKHDQRGRAKKQLAKLKETCTAELVDESVAAAPSDRDKKKRKSRNQVEAERTLNIALGALWYAHKMYAREGKRHSGTRPLSRAARRKKRQAKRMTRLLADHNVKVNPPEKELPPVAKTVKEACRRGRGQENRIGETTDAVLKWYDDPEIFRVMRRIQRWSENLDKPAFVECT